MCSVCAFENETKMELNPDNTRLAVGFIFKHFILDTAQITAVCGGAQFLNMAIEGEITRIQWRIQNFPQGVPEQTWMVRSVSRACPTLS